MPDPERLLWTERRRRWERRRRAANWTVRTTLIAGGAALLFVVLTELIVIVFGRDIAVAALRKGLNDLPLLSWVSESVPEAKLDVIIEGYWIVARTVVGGLLGVYLGRRPAEWIASKVYKPRDDWRIEPISSLDVAAHGLAGSKPMSWQAPSFGPAREAWIRLDTFLRDEKGEREVPMFAFALLLGRPGAGKSRMAAEAAAGMDNDRWDSGVIDPQRLQHLRGWRPRRPTVVLLDDPAPGVTVEVVAILMSAAQAGAFAHKVRLIIINQTMPLDLEHHYKMGAVANLVLTLGSKTFGEREIRILAPRMLAGSAATKLYMTRDINRFAVITEGNPLLVELGFEWLSSGGSLSKMTRTKLLDARLARINSALRSAGYPVDDKMAMLALTTATLVGVPCPIDRLNNVFENRIPLREVLERSFPVEGRGATNLAELLPAIKPELIGDEFVRAQIARQTPAATATTVVAAAFQLSPARYLRAVERLSGEEDPLGIALRTPPMIARDDTRIRIFLAQALLMAGIQGQREYSAVWRDIDALVAGSSEADRFALVAALCEGLIASVHRDAARRAAAEDKPAAGPGEDDEALERLPMGYLVGAAVPMFAIELSYALLKESASALERDDVLATYVTLLATVVEHSSSIGMDEHADADRDTFHDRLSRVEALLPEKAKAQQILATLKYESWTSGSNAIRTILATCITALTVRAEASMLSGIAAAQMARIAEIDVDVATEHLLKVQRRSLGDLSTAGPPYWLIITLFHNALARSNAEKSCLSLVQEIESICGHPSSVGVVAAQRWRALAWEALINNGAEAQVDRRLALSALSALADQPFLHSDPIVQAAYLRSLRQEPAESITATIERFTQSPMRMKASRHRATALALADLYSITSRAAQHSVTEAQRLATRFELISGADAYHRDVAFQRLRVITWQSLVETHKNNLALCREAVIRVEDAAASPLLQDDVLTKGALAITWARLVNEAVLPLPALALRTLEKLETLTSGDAYVDDEITQVARAAGWRAITKDRADPKRLDHAIAMIERIAKRDLFVDNVMVQVSHVGALAAGVAVAEGDIDLMRQRTRTIESIASRPHFSTQPQIQLDRMLSWLLLSQAPGIAPDEIDQAERSCAAVLKVAQRSWKRHKEITMLWATFQAELPTLRAASKAISTR